MWFIKGIIDNIIFTKLITINHIILPSCESNPIDTAETLIGNVLIMPVHSHIDIDNTSKPKLKLLDANSDYDTKINNILIQKIQHYELYENDIVCVGASTFTIKWMPFLVLFTQITWKLRESIEKVIHYMGGNIAENEDNMTHLFVPCKNVKITQTVLSAMIYGKEIITIKWLQYVSETNSFPLEKDKYIPTNIPIDTTEWLQKRKERFKGKLFIFVNNKFICDLYENIIKTFGGNVMFVSTYHDVNKLENKIVNEIKDREDIKQYAILNDTYKHSRFIENAICCCDSIGSKHEIKWYKKNNIDWNNFPLSIENNTFEQYQTNWIAFLSKAIGQQLPFDLISKISEFYQPAYHLKLSNFIPYPVGYYIQQTNFINIANTVDYVHIYTGYESYLLPQIVSESGYDNYLCYPKYGPSNCVFIGDNTEFNSPFHNYWDRTQKKINIKYNSKGKYILKKQDKILSIIDSNSTLNPNGVIFSTDIDTEWMQQMELYDIDIDTEWMQLMDGMHDERLIYNTGIDIEVESFELIYVSGIKMLYIKYDGRHSCKPAIPISESDVLTAIESKIRNERTKWIQFLFECIHDQLLMDIIKQLAQFYQPSYETIVTHLHECSEEYDIPWTHRLQYFTFGSYPYEELYSNLFALDIDYVQINMNYCAEDIDSYIETLDTMVSHNECVFVKDVDWEPDNDINRFESLKCNNKGEYLLNEDDGNTKYLLSIIDSNNCLTRDGIVFKDVYL
eukprot:513299_1